MIRMGLKHMIQNIDIRETRVYQEAREQGRREGRRSIREEFVFRLLREKLSLSKVAELADLPLQYTKGLIRGRRRGRQEIAVRLLAKRFSLTEVVDLTGLSIQHVKKLKKNPNQ